ncbi:MAG: hypothetical protein PVI26_03790, partial [Chitinispirillia bacterium]
CSFIIINQTQAKNIIRKYIIYYNTLRPHQVIDQNIPKKYLPKKNGIIVKISILCGLRHRYYREAV